MWARAKCFSIEEECECRRGGLPLRGQDGNFRSCLVMMSCNSEMNRFNRGDILGGFSGLGRAQRPNCGFIFSPNLSADDSVNTSLQNRFMY